MARAAVSSIRSPESPPLDKTRLAQFWRFVFERQQIWVRRHVEGLLPPWTSDEALRDYRFTNVYRELDPGTQYAIDAILESPVTKKDKVFNVMIYRLIGRLQTHQQLGLQSVDDFDVSEVRRKLRTIRERSEPVFTGAYIVSGYNMMGSRDKIENVCRIFQHLKERFTEFAEQLFAATSSEEAYQAIRSCQGFGNFLAFQCLVDLRYPVKSYDGAGVLPFSNDDWACAGPGAKKGITILAAKRNDHTHLQVMTWLRDNQETEFARLDLPFPYLREAQDNRVKISLANIQNCLCEYHKYVKVREGTGRARRRFAYGVEAEQGPLTIDAVV